MNNEIFQQARLAYNIKDYETALGAYTKCLQDINYPLSPGEMGLLYHQIGNCLVKLGDYAEAIHAYTQATVDSAYDACGTLNNNLGTCYAALHDYENAVKHFEIAVSDAKYDTPYKAYAGLGSALLKLGKSAEAGVAFRQAALDEKNPDPTKALLNLGICFMSLDRPHDAVSSYESALQFGMSQDMKNKLFANLGQAYVAAGQMQNAVTAFESAIADKTYYLSDSASVDYQKAVAAVSTGASASNPTKEETQAIAPVMADMSGLDVSADGSPVSPDDPYYYGSGDPYEYPEEDDPYQNPEAYGLQDGYTDAGDRFFNASDEELEQWSKGVAKQQRKNRNRGLKIIVFFIVVLLIALGALVFLYTQGYGYPSQETVVEELFTKKDTNLFADDIPDESVESMVDLIDTVSSPHIDGVNKNMSNSDAYVTASTQEGGEVTYKVSLVRDLIGWKISNVELNFASQE